MEAYTKIASTIFNLISAMFFFIGIALVISSTTTPGKYSLYNASAVQISQVYSEAIMYALQGIGFIIAAIFIHLAMNVVKLGGGVPLDEIKNNTAQTNNILMKLARALLKQ